MTGRALMLILSLAGCSSQAEVAFTNTSVDLPAATATLPPGPGADLVAANCIGCHSPEMILTQPRLTKVAWEGEVAKMIKIYKAPIAQADVPPIVAYLGVTNARLTRPAETAPPQGQAPAECAAAPCRLSPMSSSPGR